MLMTITNQFLAQSLILVNKNNIINEVSGDIQISGATKHFNKKNQNQKIAKSKIMVKLKNGDFF